MTGGEIGQVKLTENYVLNEDLPENWAIGYGQGNLNVGYRAYFTLPL